MPKFLVLPETQGHLKAKKTQPGRDLGRQGRKTPGRAAGMPYLCSEILKAQIWKWMYLHVGTTRGASMLDREKQSGRPTGRPYKQSLALKSFWKKLKEI